MDQSVEKQVSALSLSSDRAQALRIELKKRHLLDKSRRLHKIDEKTVAIPVKCMESDLKPLLNGWPDVKVCDCILPPSKQSLLQTPLTKMKNAVSDLLDKNNLSKSLMQEIPHKWECHGDLIIIPRDAFTSPQWLNLAQDLWPLVANSLSCKRIARHSPIVDDNFRSPQVVLLLGLDGYVLHCDNGIQYSYDVTKCMFSAGNITEKLRVAKFSCSGQVVVDLFAGIGYFTLPYLVHAKAKHVHACEWNPDAARYLQENLLLNGVQDKCTVHFGDNKQLDLENLADRVNLGLIPTSESSWPTAVKVLHINGGFMHIHGNVTETCSNICGNAPINNDATVDVTLSSLNTLHALHHVEEMNNPNKKRHMEVNNTSTMTSEVHSESNWTEICGVRLSHLNLSPHLMSWAWQTSKQILDLLHKIKGGQWTVWVHHVEKVKSYAPHVAHVVLDVECRPAL